MNIESCDSCAVEDCYGRQAVCMEYISGPRVTKRIGNSVDVSNKYFGLTHEELVRKLFETLAKYEDKKEQGLLIEFPCPIASTVYVTKDNINYLKAKFFGVEYGEDNGACLGYKVIVENNTRTFLDYVDKVYTEEEMKIITERN